MALKFLRKHTKIIIWMVVISFALWGGYSVTLSLSKKARFAGEVFGQHVTFQEFDLFDRANQFLTFGEASPDDPEALRRETWRNILYSREAKRRGLKISDDEVRAQIRGLFESQSGASFSMASYQYWVQNTLRSNVRDFEKQVRELLLVQKLIRTVLDEIAQPPSTEEVAQMLLRQKSLWSVRSAKFKNSKDASDFRTAWSQNRQWEEAAKEVPPSSVEKKENMDFLSLLQTFMLPMQAASSLWELEPGQLSEPLPSQPDWWVFLIDAKEIPAVDSFSEEEKKAMELSLLKEKRQFNFLDWNMRLVQEANIRDYLMEAQEASPS
ncbi:MAG: SurA N-terminal domain-containing protein [Candidatus Omnitrophota bacterium]